MSKQSEEGVPVRIGDPVHEYPDGVPVAMPPESADVPEPSGAGSKSGQKAATQKKEG